jgi:hypothetical protein
MIVNSKQIKVAVVGAGSVANEAHLTAWRRIRGTTIVAIPPDLPPEMVPLTELELRVF